MHFVYMLSYNGIPFYIGMSKSIAKRYIAHYLNCSSSTATDYCLHLLNKHNEYADIHIIGLFDNRNDAELCEVEYINKCNLAKIILTNRIGNKGNERILISGYKPTKYRFPKALKNKLINLENNYKLLYGQK